MRTSARAIAGDRSGAAAAEMALVVPLLVILLFTAFEFGNYALHVHTVQKAVRDGARFAARQSFVGMPCGGTATNESQIKNIVRTGTTATGGTPRLWYWTDPATITVAVACDTASSYSNSGIYATVGTGARRVTVTASVPYSSLVGFGLGAINVTSQSQAAVMGI
jgi:Flp pilus assembly protein TadG